MAKTFWGELAELEDQERQAAAADPDRADRYARHMADDCRGDCFCRPLAESAPGGEASYRKTLRQLARVRQPLPPRRRVS
jgi:hypothetical protein